MRPNRAGLGVPLLLVLCLLVVLGFLAYHQLALASRVGSGATRGAWGQIALRMAESGVEELMHRVQSDASDPGKPLFHQLRKEVLAGQTGDLPIGSSDRLDVLPRVIAGSPLPELGIDHSHAAVVYQRQFEDLPYERFGLLRYRVRVGASLTGMPRVVRDLEVAQGFKVVLATVPRPFDQAAVYCGDIGSLTDIAQVNRRRARYLATVADLHAGLARAAGYGPLASRYSEATSTVLSSSELASRVPELSEDRASLLVGMGNDGQEYPIDGLDLNVRLLAEEPRLEAAVKNAEGALRAVDAEKANETLHESYLRALEEALEIMQGQLDRIWAFGEGYRIVRSDDEDYQTIAGQHSRLGIDHWRRVAGFVLSDHGGLTVQQRLESLRRRMGTINGVVLAEAPSAPLLVGGSWPGKLVLVVRGGKVILDGANGLERAQDLLTVVAVGGQVEVRGDTRAAVVLASLPAAQSSGPPDSSLVMAPGATLRGALVIERLGRGSELRGSVFRSEKYYSGVAGRGARADRYAVLVSPRTVYRKVANQ